MSASNNILRRAMTAALMIMSGLAINAVAATFTVSNVNNSGMGSLRQAVLDANAATGADEIVFDASFNVPRTITLTTGPISLASDMTITGPGASLLTISGGGLSRIFATTEDPILAISGTTLTQGNGLFGAGQSPAPGFGGAIYNQGTLTLTNSVITENTATIEGGGIYNSSDDSLTVINCVFSSNIANFDSIGTGRGGAIYSQTGSTLTITNSTITGNSTRSGSDGGGIYLQDATFNMSGSTIAGNSSPQDGGGIAMTINSVVNITNSTISGNSAVRSGGGIQSALATGSISNTTISGNSAGQDGGGFYSQNVTVPSFTSSTIVNNTAARDGGGVYKGSGTINAGDSIFANNTDDGTAPDFRGGLASQGYNLIKNLAGVTITGNTTGNQLGVDPNIGALGDNGGLTFTHALLPGSPAVDRGSSFGFTTDQRTQTRPVDLSSIANAAGGDGSDIGAFELQPTVSGRVVTPTGLGLRNAIVALTDSQGIRRTATTSSFGIYSFDNVRAGQTYILGVSSKRYRFTPLNLLVSDDLANVNFVGLE